MSRDSIARTWRMGMILALALAVVSGGQGRAEERFALVIGNDAYRNVRPLHNPKNDATAISRVLTGIGFRVVLRTDATLRSMKDALREFVDALPREEDGEAVALVYFAGHGVQIGGKNYLIPVDARMSRDYEVPDETLSMDLVMRALESSGASLNMLILDCCRNNPFSRSWRGVRSSGGGGLAMPQGAPQGLFVAFATSPEEVAADGDGENSPYTEALIRHLPTEGIPFEEVFKRVGGDVSQKTGEEQQPWFNSKFYGSFSFVPEGMKVPELPGEPSKDLPGTGSAPENMSRGFTNSLGMTFLPVPGKPGVMMCRTETRVRDFRAFAEATGFEQKGGAYLFRVKRKADGGWVTDWQHSPLGSWRTPGFPDQTEDHPVVCVSLEDARAFCRWLSEKEGRRYRLPYDAEWSAAAGSSRYPWGNSFPPPQKSGNYWDRSAIRNLPGSWENSVFDGYEYDDGAERTSPVGRFAPNEFGFHDLGGNVWEWCEDAYHSAMNTPDVLKNNPVLLEESSDSGEPYRVIRGASWDNFSENTLRTGFRDFDETGRRDDDYGFRVVVEE